MEVVHPTAGWEQVGERFYRKTQLYTEVFDLDLDLDNFVVAGAPYSGAIGGRSHFITARAHFILGQLPDNLSSTLPQRSQTSCLSAHQGLKTEH